VNQETNIMAHHASETNLSRAELEFMDLMQHGDDFLKIELLRPAKSWYQKALALNLKTELVRKKIEECDRLIVFENRVIRILVAIAAVIILAVFLAR
jgi:hypothetical protein